MTDKTVTTVEQSLGPVSVSHVADAYRRYPGEIITFFTCVDVHKAMPNLTLRIALPASLELYDYQPPVGLKTSTPHVEVDTDAHYLTWSLQGALFAGSRYEYQTQVRIPATPHDASITSRAVITTNDSFHASESATVTVHAQGRYLQYLPELYARDNLMGRFLMLFESFWGPVEMQIDNAHQYFNPEMTPPDFLPWLARWFDLTMNERLPEERRRRLIKSAVPLYRQRGTKRGLKKYLEIYTGGEVYIVEHRADNLHLGAQARMGHGIALGRNNRPHTFTIILRVPQADDTTPDFSTPAWVTGLRTLIEAEKPAHTAYTLRIENLTNTP